MNTQLADDLLALCGIAVATGTSVFVTAAMLKTPDRLVEARQLTTVPLEQSAVSWAIIREPIYMVEEDERTGWISLQDLESEPLRPGR